MNRLSSKQLKVLFISHQDSGIGGAPKSLVELIKNLKNLYNVKPIVLVHSKDKVYEFCQKEEIECYITSHRDTILGAKGSFTDRIKIPLKKIRQVYLDKRAIHLLSKKLSFENIDIIHSNVSVLGLGILLHNKYNIPHVMHLRESPLIIKNNTFSHRNYIRYLNKGVSEFIAISNFTKQGWIKAGLPIDKVHKIYNGLILPPKLDHRILNNKIVNIVVVGRIQEEKGQATIIDAIGKLPEFIQKHITLDLVGVGNKDYINKLKNILDKYCLSNVRFLGYSDNIFSLLSNYDIGIMSSPSEAFGRTTVEYMAAGLCVIGADGGATPEILQNGKTGFLFKSNNSDDLAKVIMNLIKNPDLVKKVAKLGQDEAYSLYTSRKNSENVYKEYVRLLNSN